MLIWKCCGKVGLFVSLTHHREAQSNQWLTTCYQGKPSRSLEAKTGARSCQGESYSSTKISAWLEVGCIREQTCIMAKYYYYRSQIMSGYMQPARRRKTTLLAFLCATLYSCYIYDFVTYESDILIAHWLNAFRLCSVWQSVLVIFGSP